MAIYLLIMLGIAAITGIGFLISFRLHDKKEAKS